MREVPDHWVQVLYNNYNFIDSSKFINLMLWEVEKLLNYGYCMYQCNARVGAWLYLSCPGTDNPCHSMLEYRIPVMKFLTWRK